MKLTCPLCGEELTTTEYEWVEDFVGDKYFPRLYFYCDKCETEYSVSRYSDKFCLDFDQCVDKDGYWIDPEKVWKGESE